MKKWLGILLTATLASCGGETTSTPANQLTKNDFESLDGWLGDVTPPSLTKEKAHSGSYSIAVRPGIDYSLAYSNVLGRMSASRPEKMKLTAWVFVPNNQVNTNLVVEMKDPAKPNEAPLLWTGMPLKKEVKKFNEWQQIETVIPVPANANATSTFKMYLWRTDSSVPVYLDDINLTLE